MKLIVKSAVWDDLREIGLVIAAHNPHAAIRFFDASKDGFELLRTHPNIGRLRSLSLRGLRSWRIPGFQNYIIFYLPTETEVQILAVFHGARDLITALAERIE